MQKKDFFPKEPILPSRVTRSLSISYDGKTEKYVRANDSDDSDEENLFLPFVKEAKRRQKIKVMKEKHILKDTYVGKWMLFNNNKRISLARGMTPQDYMWQFVKKLVDNSQNTYIKSAHCTTGNPFPYGADPNREDGVICCFTKDYRNKYQVKKAAEAIRQVVNYPKDLYYKTDDATRSDHYKYFGNRFISIYKFTTDNKFYERDQDVVHLWNPVILRD